MPINLSFEKFAQLDLNDEFFGSLKSEYAEFSAWFASKAHEHAYVAKSTSGSLEGFLYLKVEDGPIFDFSIPMPSRRRLKIGTMKINAHGTRLGERFLKKAFDHALASRATHLYVTVFPRHTNLIKLFAKYGFEQTATKDSLNGQEYVLEKSLFGPFSDVVKNYPLIPLKPRRQFLLSLYPQWHTRLLPDSILQSETDSILDDVSHTNSIHKIYLAAMKGVEGLTREDALLIYRTSDGAGPAYYRSVATSICVVEELRHISTFTSLAEFIEYTSSYSIFSEQELADFFRSRRYPWLIRFTYNLALRKRINRKSLIEEVGLNPNAYWGFLPLPSGCLEKTLQLAGNDENTFVH